MLVCVAALPLAFAFGEASYLRFAQEQIPSEVGKHITMEGPTNYREENSDKVHRTEGGELSGQMSNLMTEDVVAKMRSNFVSVDSIQKRTFRRFWLFFDQFD